MISEILTPSESARDLSKRPIQSEYRTLKRYSLRARYDALQMNPATAFQPSFVENLLSAELETIRNYIAQLP